MRASGPRAAPRPIQLPHVPMKRRQGNSVDDGERDICGSGPTRGASLRPREHRPRRPRPQPAAGPLPGGAAGRALELEIPPRARTPPSPAPAAAARARDGDGWMDRDAEGTSGTPPGAGRARRPRPGHARPGSGAVPRFLFRLPRSRLAPVLVLSAFGPLAPPPSATQAAGGGGPPDARAAKLQATPRRGFGRQRPGGSRAPFCRGYAYSRPEAPSKGHCGGAGSVSRHPSRGC